MRLQSEQIFPPNYYGVKVKKIKARVNYFAKSLDIKFSVGNKVEKLIEMVSRKAEG
ncbi:hypothetical protein SAMN04515667_0113 [Formosa sp. Hel1_31_208]|nr:hypothetical protein SAMN04515667_0113 [Formosa sp. Hel1_31_208]